MSVLEIWLCFFFPGAKDLMMYFLAIKYVDEVVPQTTMDKMAFLKQRHFDVMFHGDEWKGTELYNKYEREFAEYGARIEYLSHTEGISSTMLRDRINKSENGK